MTFIRLRKAIAIFLRAKSLTETNVVRCFNSSNDMNNKSFAKHSSAKEFETTSTPSKSNTTFSLVVISGSNCSLTRAPSCLVPKDSPISLNLNVTINRIMIENLNHGLLLILGKITSQKFIHIHDANIIFSTSICKTFKEISNSSLISRQAKKVYYKDISLF